MGCAFIVTIPITMYVISLFAGINVSAMSEDMGYTLLGGAIVLQFFVWVVWKILYRGRARLPETPPAQMSPQEFEEYVARWLAQQRYSEIKVVGRTGDFGADVIALDHKMRGVAIQCKRYKGSTGVRAIQEVCGALKYYECEYGAVFTTGYFTRQAKELAAKNGVKLFRWIDGTFQQED